MSNPTLGTTLTAPTIAVSAVTVDAEYIRLPRPGEHDPFFGLTRSYLNLLILPSKENDRRPPVRSSVLRQGNAKTGVRMVNVESLRAYLNNQMQSAGESLPIAPDGKLPGNLPPSISNVEFLRLPKPKERDPLFGLSRSFLNELILPCADNGYHPPVQSHVLRRRGFRTGIRLISVDSLRDYIMAHEEPVGSPSAATATSPGSGQAVY
jgi:hypothetical protein